MLDQKTPPSPQRRNLQELGFLVKFILPFKKITSTHSSRHSGQVQEGNGTHCSNGRAVSVIPAAAALLRLPPAYQFNLFVFIMFMELPVSGLHRLFHSTPPSAAPNSPRSHAPLESVTEEAHTFNLLFPELSALRQAQGHTYPLQHTDPSSAALAANSPDDRGGLDIRSPRDVRIIIAQDGNVLSQQPRILYDSQPPPLLPAARQGTVSEAVKAGDEQEEFRQADLMRRDSAGRDARPPTKKWHSRSSSLVQTPQSQSPTTSPSLPRSPEIPQGAFSNPRLQRSATRPATSEGETTQGRLVRESREETEALLGCMFGSTGLPLVSSTKLHIKPPGSSDVTYGGDFISTTPDPANARIFAKRRTPLKRSTTAEDLYNLSSSSIAEQANQHTLRPGSTSILITRLFSVDSISTSLSEHTSTTSNPTSNINSKAEENQNAKCVASLTKTEKGKQLKIPTYAVAVVLQLPHTPQRPVVPSLKPDSSNAWQFDSSNQHMSRADAFPWDDPLESLTYLNSAERNLEHVIMHWNILTRAISSLEVVARSRIFDLLSKVSEQTSKPFHKAPIEVISNGAGKSHTNLKLKKPKQPSQRTVQLQSSALQQRDEIHLEASATGERVALALKIRRVVAGQGRWGMWREEARWVGRWAGGREQNFFFFNLLTAFLGCHTEWLDSLGPSWYRSRHSQLLRGSLREISTIQHRTVIVSTDKMASRRLIFLLAAFLPSIHVYQSHDGTSRPASSLPITGYSQSPPSGVSMLRQQSLRRSINKKSRGSRAGNNVRSHERSVSFTGQDFGSGDSRIQQHSRRTSDTRSIKTLPLPIAPDGAMTRKSSTTTTATAVPDPAVPVPHFSSYSKEPWMGTSAEPRPGSSGSLASLSLKHTLSRSESNDRGQTTSGSQSSRGWGSVISGFWSVRRNSSTDDSDAVASSQEGLGISGVPKDFRDSRSAGRSAGKLARMVEEVEASKARGTAGGNVPTPEDLPSATTLVGSPENITGYQSSDQSTTPAKNIPQRPKPEHFPVKLSVDESDGVVDVDIPMTNSYSSSFTSSLSSPKGSHTAASSLNDRSSLHTRPPTHKSSSRGSEPAIDVAGWLKKYHQDFALQAVRPYDALKEDIKGSMRAEPYQPPPPTIPPEEDGTPSYEWTDICTTLIADTTNYSVTRLCLQRRAVRKPSTSSPEDAVPEEAIERIHETHIMDLDSTLIDAVERVLAQSGHSSRAPSRAPSPSRFNAHNANHHGDLSRVSETSPSLEVPRSECRKMVLGALEQVAMSVSAELEQGRNGGNEKERRRGVKIEGMPDSSLREGVRRWLGDVAGVQR